MATLGPKLKHFIEPWLGLDELEMGGTTLSQPCSLLELPSNLWPPFVGSVSSYSGIWVHHQEGLKQRLNLLQRAIHDTYREAREGLAYWKQDQCTSPM